MANDNDVKKSYEEVNGFTDDIFEDGRDQGVQENREKTVFYSQNEIKSDEPNEATYAAMAEGERMIHGASTKRFSSVEDLFAELDEE